MQPEKLLSELIQIPSVNPPGKEEEIASYIAELFRRKGIEGKLIYAAPGRANFVAQIGTGKRRLLFLAHTDVVPAGEGWEFEPFSGEIRNGYVHGRGALDCKNLLAAEMSAFLSLAGNPPREGVLIFAASADEEAGSTYGVQYLLQHHRELLAADFALTEGAEEPISWGKNRLAFIQVGEKGICWVRLRAEGRSCHGSMPALGDNAVVKMTRAIQSLAEYRPERTVIPEIRPLIKRLREVLFSLRNTPSGKIKLAGDYDSAIVTPNDIDRLIETLNEQQPEVAAYLQAITQMTVSPNMIGGGIKTNIVPASSWAEVDIRILPGQDREYVTRELAQLLPPGIEVELLSYHAPTVSPTHSPHYRLIESAAREVTGDTFLPQISAAGTDSRFLRDAGIPSYSVGIFSPRFDSSLRATIHGPNERIDVESLYLMTDFFRKIAEKYLY